MSPLRVERLDHVVLNVADTRRSIGWYCDLIGLEPLRLDEWERGEVFFASVRVNADTIIDLLEVGAERVPEGSAPRNVDHLCLVLAEGTDLAALADSGNFEVIDGPAIRWGARGDGTSLYVRDPDGNTVELRTYA